MLRGVGQDDTHTTTGKTMYADLADCELAEDGEGEPMKPECLPLGELLSKCVGEMQQYRTRHILTDSCRLELFRRAICQQDQEAWQMLYFLFNPLVCTWIWQYGRGADWLNEEEVASLANVAFAKLARSMTPTKLEHFTSIGALLQYFKRIVGCVVADERTSHNQQEETVGLLTLAYRGATEDPANTVVSSEAVRMLLQRIFACLKDDCERTYFIQTYVYGMKPQEIVQRSSQLFPTVKDVYRVRANIQDRLRRSYKYRQGKSLPAGVTVGGSGSGNDPERESFPTVHTSLFGELVYE